MRVRRSIKNQIVFAIAVILVPAVALIAFILRSWYNARYDLAFTATRERATSAADNFNEYISSLDSLALIAGEAVLPSLPHDPAAASAQLATYLHDIGSLTDMAFVNPSGIVIAGAPSSRVVGVNVSDRPYFKQILAGQDLALSNVIISRFTGEPSFGIARAIRVNGRLVGVVIMAVGIDHLDAVFRPHIGEELLILLDANDTLVYHSRHPHISWAERQRLGRIYAKQVRTHAPNRLVPLESPIDTGEWIGDWSNAPDFGWVVGDFRRASLVTGPIRTEFVRAIAWAIATLVLIGLIIWYLGNRISKPAVELAKSAESVAEGNLNTRARVTGEDEFGLVARSFNQMVERLQAARAESEARQHQIELLYEAGLAVTTTLGLEDVLNIIVREIERITSASIVEVWLYDPERMEITVRSQIGLPESNVMTRFAIGEGVPGEVARTKKPVMVEDVPSMPDLIRREMVESVGLRSLLAVPLVFRDETVGVIDLFTKQRHVFTREEIELVSTLASIAATAITNSQLFERERNIARTLEAAFVPSRVEAPGMDIATVYHPRTVEAEIGGDFLDVIPLRDGWHGIVIGDVAGKGLQAAVYTNMIKYSLRAYASDELAPNEVVGSLNRIVIAATELDRFATLIYCCVDADARRMIWVNAGHEDPLVYRAATRTVEILETGSTAVGVFPDIVYRQDETSLSPGDRVILYTDGVSEARHNSVFFGTDGLRRTVSRLCPCSARELADGIFADANEFARGHLTDDVAILVFGPEGNG